MFDLRESSPGQARITLSNATIRASILTLGAAICELWVPDESGVWKNVVLGFKDEDSYRINAPYFGAIVGRYANRIANSTFILDGRRLVLSRNEGPHSLHGGRQGFSHRTWSIGSATAPDCAHLYRVSEDGEEGYPGRLLVDVFYTLLNGALRIDYRARSDATTVINLTNHTYFNLAGEDTGHILDHRLTVLSHAFTPVAEGLIPTGELRAVRGGPFDFRVPTPIGARIELMNDQLRLGGGYDHNWMLTKSKTLASAAFLHDPKTGRSLELLTSEPGLQIYTGNKLDGSIRGFGGATYPRHAGVALEAQHFPDSPNHLEFPTTTLQADELYASTTVWRFFNQPKQC